MMYNMTRASSIQSLHWYTAGPGKEAREMVARLYYSHVACLYPLLLASITQPYATRAIRISKLYDEAGGVA